MTPRRPQPAASTAKSARWPAAVTGRDGVQQDVGIVDAFADARDRARGVTRLAREHDDGNLRPPSIAHGVVSFIWALFFFLFIWIGGVAVGYSGAVMFIVGAVVGFLCFLLIRVYGEDEPRTP